MGIKLKSDLINPLYCIQDNQTTPVVKDTQTHCATTHNAGKITVCTVKQERKIAGKNSKNRDLKQGNHHHIKGSNLTDGGKKLSLTGKLKLSDHHDQGMTDFIYLYLSCYVHVYKNTHTFICSSLVKRLSSHIYGTTKLVFWSCNLSVLAEVLTCHQKFKLKLSDLARSQASRQ